MHLVKRSSRHLPARGEDWTNLAGLTKDAISTLLILTDANFFQGSCRDFTFKIMTSHHVLQVNGHQLTESDF